MGIPCALDNFFADFQYDWLICLLYSPLSSNSRLIGVASGSRVLERKFIGEHVYVDVMHKYNYYFVAFSVFSIVGCTFTFFIPIAYAIDFYEFRDFVLRWMTFFWLGITFLFICFFREPPREFSNVNTFELESIRKKSNPLH